MTESEKCGKIIMAENGDNSWAAREIAAGASLSEIATELAPSHDGCEGAD
jgi:hypothetical protein